MSTDGIVEVDELEHDDRDDHDDGAGPTSTAPGRKPAPRWKRSTNKWSRILHVYTSMIALLVVLFFGVSGLTLNHPTWTFGDQVDVRTETGTLPSGYLNSSGEVDFLAVSEFVRDTYDVTGRVDSYDVVNGQGSIAYKNPGYAADLFFAVDGGTYELRIEQQGWVGVMNDLHKGRDANSTWKWVIDVSAILLVVISLTGLLMQFFLRKRRRSALISAGAGVAVLLVLIYLAVR